MKTNLFFFVVILLFGCNANNAKTQQNAAEEKEVKNDEHPVSATFCYDLENWKDTVLLKINFENNKVSGDLIYNYFEKDRNNGTIKGEMKGDTLFATYTFMSEGKESEREIVFLKKGDKLIEGYPEINSATGEPDFTNHAAIKFDDKFALQKSDCQ